MSENDKNEEIKKLNKGVTDIDKQKEQREIEMNQRNPGVIKHLPANDDKSRKNKEKARLQQDERNAGLRINSNGDRITEKGNVIDDRTSQVQTVEKWKEDIEKQRALNGKKRPEKEIDIEERVKK